MDEKIKIVHFSDLHFGSGERYGTLNPESGLNKRFEDFISALDKPVNFAIEYKVDLVIFTGDTYKHATPEPIYQKEFAKRIKKLSINNIPVVLLVGNHDVLYRIDGSDALDIYSTLEIEKVTVFNKIELKTLETKSGKIQIISLPHITKSRLLAREENRKLNGKEQDELMKRKVKEAISGCIEKLIPQIPALLLGHGTIETAQFGSEQDLSIGKVLSYPLGYFQIPELDYVGFGHIHRHQVLQEKNPLILYAGSLERVDFGEENEDKGFIYLEIVKGNVSYEFKSTNPRKFLTIFCDLTQSESLQKALEEEIKKHQIKDAVVRLKYRIGEENAGQINLHEVKNLLENSFQFTVQVEIENKERTYRIEELNSDLIAKPIVALEKYLFDYSEEDKNLLLEKAKELMD